MGGEWGAQKSLSTVVSSPPPTPGPLGSWSPSPTGEGAHGPAQAPKGLERDPEGVGHCAWSPDLAKCGLLVAQAHDEDAIGLAQAAHGPGGQRCVCLVEHDAVRVLLLGQPP